VLKACQLAHGMMENLGADHISRDLMSDVLASLDLQDDEAE
jgi:hypothetical protein